MTYLSFSEASKIDNAILRCPFDLCHARIIRLLPSLYSTKTTIEGAPKMTKDSLNFFQIGDMWDFDNIGVLKTIDLASTSVGPLAKVERLLICSECDQGPIGFAGYIEADQTDVKKLVSLLSCESVLYDTKQ